MYAQEHLGRVQRKVQVVNFLSQETQGRLTAGNQADVAVDKDRTEVLNSTAAIFIAKEDPLKNAHSEVHCNGII